MAIIDNNSSSFVFRDKTPEEYTLQVTTSEEEVLEEPAFESEVTINDIIVDRSQDAVVRTDGQISTSIVGELVKDTDTISFESLDTSIGTVDGTGRVTWQSDGTVGILIKSRFETKRVDINVNKTSPVIVDEFNRWSSDNSLSKHLENYINSVLDGKTPSDATRKIFTSQDHDTSTYVFNSNFFDTNLDFSGVAIWNSQGGFSINKAVMLISPRHVIGAAHFFPAHGSTIRFVKQDGSIVERTLTNSTNPASDIRVGILDSEITDINFYKMLPTDVKSKFAPSTDIRGLWGILLNRNELVSVGRTQSDLGRFSKDAENYGDWWTDFVSGDSAHPGFYVINGELVLASSWWTASSGWVNGPDYVANRSDINTAMSDLGGGHQVTDVDLSGFESYA